VHHYGMDGHVCKMQRMVRKTHNLILNFCLTNLFNFVLRKKCTGVDPHYFDVWEPAYQGNADVAERQVTSSFYSHAIFVMLILNSIFYRTDVRMSGRRSTCQMYKTRGRSPSTSMLHMPHAEVPHMEGK
jgi:hypothetical protein